MGSLYAKFDRQSPVVKGVVVVGAGLLVYGVYKAIKKEKDKKEATQAAQQAAAELALLQSQGIRPSYQLSQYLSYADKLVQAMNGCGTDESMIYSVFNAMKNEADVLQLITSFGLRYYTPCPVSDPISYTIWQFNDHAYGGELSTWLSYDLSDNEISKINSILRSKGITFQF
jgi:hypothetical protein